MFTRRYKSLTNSKSIWTILLILGGESVKIKKIHLHEFTCRMGSIFILRNNNSLKCRFATASVPTALRVNISHKISIVYTNSSPIRLLAAEILYYTRGTRIHLSTSWIKRHVKCVDYFIFHHGVSPYIPGIHFIGT